MPLIEVLLTIECDSTRCEPEVGAWVDLRPAVGLRSEFALPLQRCAAQRWRGAFTIGESEPGYFLYRFGMAAHEGAHWTLNIRHRSQARVSSVLVDGDCFSIPKHWLVGTCVVPNRQPRAEAHAQAYDQTRRPGSTTMSRQARGTAIVVPFRPLV
jgi:hypothetical protein